MPGRVSRSIQVAKESYRVLRTNPSLAIFPILSAIASIIVSIPFAVPLVLVAIAQSAPKHHAAFNALDYVLTFCLYFANYFVTIFFNSALVACANEELNGRHATVAFGVETAMKRLPQILGWTLVSSTVGLVLRMIGERMGLVGTIVISLIGFVWNIAVFFVVPCLVLDRVGPIEAIKDSTATIKKTWGESLLLDVGIGTATGLLMILCILPFGLGIAFLIAHQWILGGAFMFLGLVYVLAVGIAASAMTSIFQTALFIYCRTGEVPAGFQAASVQGAFREKPARKLFGRSF